MLLWYKDMRYLSLTDRELASFMGWTNEEFYEDTVDFSEDYVFDQVGKILKFNDFDYDRLPYIDERRN